jgi:hypothetical protein
MRYVSTSLWSQCISECSNSDLNQVQGISVLMNELLRCPIQRHSHMCIFNEGYPQSIYDEHKTIKTDPAMNDILGSAVHAYE